MRVLVYAAAYAFLACGAEAFSVSPGPSALSVRTQQRTGAMSLRAAAQPSVSRRGFGLVVGSAGLAQLAAPQVANAIDFRKMITGEESEECSLPCSAAFSPTPLHRE